MRHLTCDRSGGGQIAHMLLKRVKLHATCDRSSGGPDM